MADWVAISSLATAGGTLALAGTTYASVRSANRAARAAERSLLAQLRPLIVESFEQDPVQRVNFVDINGIAVAGGAAAVEVIDERLYLVFSLRNVGSGIGVLYGGRVFGWRANQADRTEVLQHGDPGSFRMLSRDIYIPAGKVGFWQIAWRDREAEERDELLLAVDGGELAAELMYGDFEGGQRMITRFRVLREDDGVWRLYAVRHWQVDRAEPRPL